MKLAETVTFGGSALDRAAHLRSNLEALLKDPAASCLPIWRGKPMLHGEVRAPVWLPMDHPVLADRSELVFLGLDDGVPRFAADTSQWEPEEMPDTLGAFFDPSEQQHPDLPPDHVFAELRSVMTHLTPRAAELVATAKAILGWHSSHLFCSKCGAPSEPSQAGWQRDCPDCGAHHFPRTDPVVIMLITRGNSVLLGRSPNWPEGMYSLLAGFVEPGETIEAAVRREVFEESGVRVGRVDYLSSQPWPFPASLMFGCRGSAETEEIEIDPNEIEHAMWVSKERLVDAFAGRDEAIKPARKGAIARFLLEHWLADCLD